MNFPSMKTGRSFQTYCGVTDEMWRAYPATFSALCAPPAAWRAGLLLVLKVCFSRATAAALDILPTCWNFRSGPHQSTPFLPLNYRPSAVQRWLSWLAAPNFRVERTEGWYSDCLRSWRTYHTTSVQQACCPDSLYAFIGVDEEKEVLWRLWDWALTSPTPSHSVMLLLFIKRL